MVKVLDLLKELRKKGLEAPSTLMVMIIFIVGLAIVILVILYFSNTAGAPTSAFTNETQWGRLFKWF